MLKPGQTVDRYLIEDRIGVGGLAIVYRVRHLTLGTHHALKVLSLKHPKVEARFLKEGQLQATIRHPNIVAVSDIIPVEDSYGLVMEYISGPGLDRWIVEQRPGMDLVEKTFLGILAGVRHAHSLGLIHRDLKPGNILLAPVAGQRGKSYTPKVADFGLARAVVEAEGGVTHTQSGIGLGTPAYMAPEQIRDARSVDKRADIFALGCILYEMSCGRRVFPGDNILDIYNAVIEARWEDPQRLVPGLAPRIASAIRGCLKNDLSQRIPDCDALEDILTGKRSWPDLPELTEEFHVTEETLPERTLALPPPVAVPELPMLELPSAPQHPPPLVAPLSSAGPPPVPQPLAARMVPRPVKVERRSVPRHVPSAHAPAPSPPRARTQSWVLLLLTLLFASLVLLWWYLDPTETDPVASSSERATEQSTPTAEPSAALWELASASPPASPPPVVPTPAPQPVERAASPEPRRASVPEPSETKAPVAEPARSTSAPSAAEPTSTTAQSEPTRPRQTAEYAQVQATGEATRLWLESGSTRHAIGRVPPGSYVVRAIFGGAEPVSAGRLTLAAGDNVTIKCVAAFQVCSRVVR